MEENLNDILFDLLTKDYNDKIDKKKDLIDYLKEKSKNELLYLYLVYGYGGNNKCIEDEIIELQKKNKEEILKRTVKFLDDKIVSIIQLFDYKRMKQIKYIARSEDFTIFNKNKKNQFSLEIIKILVQLGFIYCKRAKDEIIIHMPKYIKDNINSVSAESHPNYYDEIVLYSKGIADTYGAIYILDAFDIIKDDIQISFEEYEHIIKFISALELEPIYFSIKYQSICNFNLRDEEAVKILENNKEIFMYDREIYEDIGNNNYLKSIKEYKEFRNFLLNYYGFDINEDEMLIEDVICDYIENAQLDEKKAKEDVEKTIDRYFDIDELEKQVIINYVEKIRRNMPRWILGGKIDNLVRNEKIGRNSPCPCGSGKKYKNCCGKNA